MLWLKRQLYKLATLIDIYAWWCRTYQWRNDSQYFWLAERWVELQPNEAAALLRLLRWQADGLRELGDAAHHPGYVVQAIEDTMRAATGQMNTPDMLRRLRVQDTMVFLTALENYAATNRGRGQDPDGSLDCEDFALWAARAIAVRYEPVILVVAWSTGFCPWQMAGHAVCVYREPDGVMGYMDLWHQREDVGRALDEVVNDILHRQGGHPLVGWRVYRPADLIACQVGAV